MMKNIQKIYKNKEPIDRIDYDSKKCEENE